MHKGLWILSLVILCTAIALTPNLIGNPDYESHKETIIDYITLEQSLPIAIIVFILGMILIALSKECTTIDKQMTSTQLQPPPLEYT